MTLQPDFAGVRIKIERAKEHVRNLKELVRGFQQSEPYRIITEDDPDTGDLAFKVKVSGQPPPYWGAIVGDAIHNLRSSLDLLVCELVRANGKEVTENTGFLISKSAKAFKSGHLGKIKGVPKEAMRLIKEAKPYKGGDEAFWRLHCLDIADKHKLLIPVGVAYRSVILDAARAFDHAPDLPAGLVIPQDFSLPIAIRPADRQFPLKDGAKLFSVSAQARSGPGAQMHENPQFAFDVAFGEGEVVEGEPLFPTLPQLGQFVEGFVELFPPLFSQELPPDVPPSTG